MPSTSPIIVRGCLFKYVDLPVFCLCRTDRMMLCPSLSPQLIPPITTSVIKLNMPPPANGTFAPARTAMTKNTVTHKSTIENILFQRTVKNFTCTVSPVSFSNCHTVYLPKSRTVNRYVRVCFLSSLSPLLRVA